MGHHDPGKIYLVAGKRTPFGKFGGSLGAVSPMDLCYFAAKAMLEEINLSSDKIDQVIVANVIPSSPATLYCARHLAIKLGMPIETPALMMNRLCGSGFEAIIQAKRLIDLGEAQAILVAGVENMTMIPHLTYGARFGTKYGNLNTKDFLLDTLTDEQAEISMGLTAEALAEEYKTSKAESDEFSFQSHVKAEKAWSGGKFNGEVAPISAGKLNVIKDEHLRSDAKREDFEKLRPTFKKDGVVTAGSASGIVDGAACVLVASEEFLKKNNLKGLAQITGHAVVGVDPKKMGIGPVPAIKKVLTQENLNLKEIDLLEINEAFAPQAIACVKALDYPMEKVNIWGGAVALGHPLGATGIRLTLTLARQLKDNQKTKGIASACIGGGQGISILLSREGECLN